MKKQGLKHFRSLTTDNGSGFSTLSLLEKESSHLQVFFAHAAWERGTNERHNRLLREFIPKDQSLRNLKYSDLQKYTEAINARQRRIQGYESSYECFEHEHLGVSYHKNVNTLSVRSTDREDPNLDNTSFSKETVYLQDSINVLYI